MLSNLERAVLEIFNNKEAPTVARVFGTYVRISGLDDGDAGRSVAAFERALDKHSHRGNDVSKVVATVRNDYWYTKLGGSKDGGGQCHICEHCGVMTLPGTKIHRHKYLPNAGDSQPVEEGAQTKVKAVIMLAITTSLMALEILCA
ncbi:hypothetical protein H0H87_005889 [Tephrocybe sp. NHM501043]|nr:hypothetical protein H0H87_005889 [Tephrocybe sp. NHM501043]